MHKLLVYFEMNNTPTDPIRTLDLNLLRLLVALVEERSTVKVGQQLFLSQSTVSGALARLRVIFGDTLLVRNGRALEPTARALELVGLIKPHLDGLASSLSSCSQFDPAADTRVFRFGCTDAAALALLPRLTHSIRDDAPACDLVVRIGDYLDLPNMLATNEISTALGYLRNSLPATTKTQVLKHSPWVVLRDHATGPVEDIRSYCARPHALVTPRGDLTGFVDDALRGQGYGRRVAIGVASFSLLLSILPGSDLVATVPDFVAERLAALGGLAIDTAPVAIPVVANSLAWRATADNDPAERWFRATVRRIFAAPSGS